MDSYQNARIIEGSVRETSECQRAGNVPRILRIEVRMVNGSVQSITAAVSGRLGHYRINGLLIEVRVLDARKVWGRIDLLIEPTNGIGTIWVARTQVEMVIPLTMSDNARPVY